jgi:predicted SnoaL-like aldol condensation-catalyzing enzyme
VLLRTRVLPPRVRRSGKIHLVLGSGNFVLTASEGLFNKQPTAFFGLFRVGNGKLAEHWDTLEAMLTQSE